MVCLYKHFAIVHVVIRESRWQGFESVLKSISLCTYSVFRLFSGTMENTQIAYNIKYLMCLADTEKNICDLMYVE